MAINCGYCNDKGCVICVIKRLDAEKKPLYVQHSFTAFGNKNVPLVAIKVYQPR